MINKKRLSGVLLHPTSFPGPYGIGDLGPEAYKFVDFLVSAGQSLWQVLPLGPTGYGDSPYACYSAFAGNTLLVSPEQLIADNLLTKESRGTILKGEDERIDFEVVHKHKDSILRQAFTSFGQTSGSELRNDFAKFCVQHAAWLDDYALFRALKNEHGGVAWNEWDPALVRRDARALETAREKLEEQIEAQKFYQFLFFRQW